MSLLRKLFLRGSAKGATAEGDVTSTNVDANTQALDVVVKNSISATVTNSMPKGVVDPNNSSTTPLASFDTFEGTATDCSEYSSITFSFSSDKDTFIAVDFSSDGITWNAYASYGFIPGLNEINHTVPVYRKYYRLRAQSASLDPQTFLNLEALLGHQGLQQKPLSITPNLYESATTTKSFLYGEDPDTPTVVNPVKVSSTGEASVISRITDGAGVVNTKQLGTQLTTNDVGLVANTVIHGLSSAGGGTFVDVKVNPAGKLEVNDVDTQTKLSDGSQKTQIVDNAGDNLGTDANPIVVTASTTTQGVSTFQQQYNQTELLFHILEELQEQTRILKKIYQ